jgi:hypothetical protein
MRTFVLSFVFFAAGINSFAADNPYAEASRELCEEEAISKNPPLNLSLYALHMPFLNQPAFGAGFSMAGNYASEGALGLNLNVAGRNITRDFGYEIGEARLTYFDISLFHEYRLQQWNRLSVAFNLYAGLASFRLSDNSIKEKYTWVDEYGITYEGERALPVENNYYMRIAPAANLRYQLSPQIDVEASGVYNFYAGGSRYGRTFEFNGYMVQLGLRFIL